jgi:enamine deaminase RidA (YjgF/YER057c/UK114 family)
MPPNKLTIVNPPELGAARGFSHGVLAPAGGRRLIVAGQAAADAEGHVADRPFVEQFNLALARVLAVVREAGGTPDQITRMMIYVTSIEAYRNSRPALRAVWRRQMGSHYPAMALVQVVALVDEHAMLEIEAEAMVL